MKKSSCFPIVPTLVFFALAFIGILHHEMWRDELHAWLIAVDSHTLGDLWNNCRYEGHPILWFALLFVLSRFSRNPILMQLLSLLIGCGSVYLFCAFSNFTRIQKVLFPFGYFMLFEYTMISRSYGLGIFLILLFCAFYRNRSKNTLPLFIVASLMCNVSLHDLIIAVGLCAYLAIDHLRTRTAVFDKKFIGGMIILAAGAALSIARILPPGDSTETIPLQKACGYLQDIFGLAAHFYNTFLLLPELLHQPSWLSWTTPRYPSNDALILLLFVIAGTALLLPLLRKPQSLLLFAALSCVILFSCCLSGRFAPRHTGSIFLSYIAAMWLSNYRPDHEYHGFMAHLANFGARSGKAIFTAVLVIQLVAGILLYKADLVTPFSCTAKVAQFLKVSNLDNIPVMGEPDFCAEPFAALLNKPIYYPERNAYGTFIEWKSGTRGTPEKSLSETIATIGSGSGGKMILLFNTDFVPASFRLNHLKQMAIPPDIVLDLLGEFGGSMCGEDYCAFLAHRSGGAEAGGRPAF